MLHLGTPFRSVYSTRHPDRLRSTEHARREVYTNFIAENSCDQGKLFRATKHLLKQNTDVPYPPHHDKYVLANDMRHFFVQKIIDIQNKLDSADIVNTEPLREPGNYDHVLKAVTSFDELKLLTEEDVRKLIMKSTKKSCAALDPMPTPLVVDCIDVLLPVLTKMINLFLDTTLFPDDWKEALVMPLLKKYGLDLVFKNYLPVSNLPYVSKLTERTVFDQLHGHMTVNSLYPALQSSYRKHHSTETALLKVKMTY